MHGERELKARKYQGIKVFLPEEVVDGGIVRTVHRLILTVQDDKAEGSGVLIHRKMVCRRRVAVPALPTVFENFVEADECLDLHPEITTRSGQGNL